MKYLNRASLYGANLHVVELEGDETTFSDAKLLHMADNHYKVQDWWPEVEAGKRHPGHFGGIVNRNGNKAEIKVWID